MIRRSDEPVVLVTGAARRIGAAIARALHGAGWRVVIHYRRSAAEAQALAAELEAVRADSAHTLAADLADPVELEALALAARTRWQRLDALVNNASGYYATPVGAISAAAIDDLVASNLKGPLLLVQACAPLLEAGGAIVNILDVHVRQPQKGYAAYTAAKAGLWAATEALAVELGPRLRVNAVAPGYMLWAEDSSMDAAAQARALARVPLRRLGGADEVGRAVRFLLSPDAAYITGVVLPVDGGLRLV